MTSPQRAQTKCAVAGAVDDGALCGVPFPLPVTACGWETAAPSERSVEPSAVSVFSATAMAGTSCRQCLHHMKRSPCLQCPRWGDPDPQRSHGTPQLISSVDPNGRLYRFRKDCGLGERPAGWGGSPECVL